MIKYNEKLLIKNDQYKNKELKCVNVDERKVMKNAYSSNKVGKNDKKRSKRALQN